MAAVAIDALFTPSAHVEFHEFEDGVPHVPGVAAVAIAAVAGDGTLAIAGLKGGRYWAIIDANPPIAVRVRGSKVTRVSEDGRRTRERPLGPEDTTEGVDPDRAPADTLVEGDAKSAEAPVVTPDVVTGPRTTANARVQPSLIDKAKAKLKGGRS